MKKTLVFLLSFMVYSCGDTTSSSKISKKVERICLGQNTSCRISFQNIITEDWDYVLISTESFSLKDLNNHLGFEYPYFVDIGKRIIFVKDNNVVYHEDEFPHPERTRKGELIFEMGRRNFMKVEREKAIFIVEKENNYFILNLQQE